ncbi:ribonuclease [Sphingomonas sp.]|uniref:ribonuclease n=1 Tax=Sphingomonas sp. TaxID=28214 RepID=UPI001D969B6E|nr:ribonuclease [Sphingomonas sp.]MBX9797380.1 ribonuclease [Sphingomonas sp.]
MAEWLIENGIGEVRAALVDDGRIVKARIELPGLRLGSVVAGRLAPARRVRLEGGGEIALDGPAGAPEGTAVRVRITREAIPEPGRLKPARGVVTDAPLAPGPDLRARLAAGGIGVREGHAHAEDALEAAGWGELLDEATTGDIGFAGGMLRMTPTPAMTLFDVDGDGPLEPLAVAAAAAVAAAIVRHGIGGSIGIDFPTLAGKAARAAVAAAIDAALPPPFERTALNGFGFLQIVRPRPRAALPELLRADPLAAAARALLRRLERTPAGATPEPVPPALAPHILPEWRAELARRTGRTWSL